MSKKHKKQAKWKVLENRQNKIKEQHMESSNKGFKLPEVTVEEENEESTETTKEDEEKPRLPIIRQMISMYGKKPTIEEFDTMYKLIIDKYEGVFMDVPMIIHCFKTEFGFITTENEICDYLDVTLADDIKDKEIMMNIQGFNVEID